MKYCDSCSTTALKFNQAFNKGFKPRKAVYDVEMGGKKLKVCKSCLRIAKANQ